MNLGAFCISIHVGLNLCFCASVHGSLAFSGADFLEKFVSFVTVNHKLCFESTDLLPSRSSYSVGGMIFKKSGFV